MRNFNEDYQMNAHDDAEINRGIAQDPDTFEATDEDFARAKPAAEVIPTAAFAMLKLIRLSIIEADAFIAAYNSSAENWYKATMEADDARGALLRESFERERE